MEDDYELFLHRVPTVPMAQDLRERIELVLEDIPEEARGMTFWAFNMEGEWKFSFLGMVCMLEGFDVTEYERNEQEIPCTDYLLSSGFSRYDLLALGEIDKHSYDTEVLVARAEHYMETGERMDFHDGLVEYDAQRRLLRG